MIPWVLSDTNYVRGPHQRLDTSWTVFVGGLHGMLNAGGTITIIYRFSQGLKQSSQLLRNALRNGLL